MSSQSSNQITQSNEQQTQHSFQVVCSVCHKTISYSGSAGEICYAKCDQCEGV